MRHLNIFEEFKFKKKKVLKHLDKEKGGVEKILGNITAMMPKEKDSTIDVLGDILKFITKRFGLKGKVKYMNSGLFGMAFVVGDDKVIKLTSSSSEAAIAMRLMKVKKIPHCIKYYDVVFIKKYDVYAILMDKVEKLSREEKKAINILVDSEFILNNDPLFIRRARKKGINLTDDELMIIFDDYCALYFSLKRNNVSTMDLHSGNIGYIESKLYGSLRRHLVHFDIMDNADLRKDIKKIPKIKIK